MAVESTTGVNLSDAMILADVPLGDWLVIALADPRRRRASDVPALHAHPGPDRDRRAGAASGRRYRSSRPRARSGPGGDDDGPLAAAIRHRLRGRRAGRDAGRDVGAGGTGGGGILAVRHRCDRPPIRLLSLSAADDGGCQRLVPDRRHLQPLCLVRGLPDLVLRPDHPGVRTQTDRRRDQIRGAQPRRHDAVPDRDRSALRRVRHAEHGRHRTQGSGIARDRAADDAGRDVSARVRHEGDCLPGQFLVAGLLPYAADRDRRAVRRTFDQGRHLRLAAHGGDAVRANAQSLRN